MVNVVVSDFIVCALGSLGYDGPVRVLPRIPATDECSCFSPTCLPKFLRHPGAGRFVWSSAVGDQPRLLRQLQFIGLDHYVLRDDANRAGRLEIARLAAALCPNIQKFHWLTRIL